MNTYLDSIKAVVLVLSICLSLPTTAADENEWTRLFNGENLDGWIVKNCNHELDDNYANTFRVEEIVHILSK
jgi:hypothetical protein